jgi:ABC-type Mn2+/Zn2+ transport system ATPase subunit
MSNSQNYIRLSGIKKTYHEREVLLIDDFIFEHGARYAILGANGAGKSTLLRILAGTLPTDEGKIEYHADYGRQDIAYMPQKPYPFAMRVEKSVLIDASRMERRDGVLAAEALARVGMTGFEKQRGDRLSGGEAQRVALARMILRPRKLLLLDEPSSATDVAGTQLIEKAILEFCTRTGCTLVFSTHSPAQAIRLAGKAVFLDGGRIQEAGDVKKVVTAPSSESAKAFLHNWTI